MPLICPSCNSSNRDDARFCFDCGAQLQGAPLTGALPANAILQNRYLIVCPIGRGGMGAVYEAMENRPGSGRRWAVKEMSDQAIDPGERTQAIDGFRREADLLAALAHRNLPKAQPPFYENGKWYFAMDFVEGKTLLDLMRATPGLLPEAMLLGWVEQLCDVLDYLHGQQPPIIFRDLKPENVMVEDGTGLVKLIDFGIARFFDPTKGADTRNMGSAGYAPPEQYGRGQTDVRSDVYALAATMYHLLTRDDPGDHPFNFAPIAPINHTVSGRIEATIFKALQSDPQNRHQTAGEFKAALLGASTSQQLTSNVFHFRNGAVAHNVVELVRLCDQHWDDAKYHLRSGHFTLWLRATEPKLAGLAEAIAKKTGDEDARLEEFLHLLDDSLPDPSPAVNPTFFDFGELAKGQKKILKFKISNQGRGYLKGTISASATWLNASPRSFACLPGQDAEVTVTLTAPAQVQTLTTTLGLGSNGGNVGLTVQGQVVEALLLPGSGAFIRDLNELVRESGSHWAEIKKALYDGSLEKWLGETLLRFDLVSRAESVREEKGDQDVGLTTLLAVLDSTWGPRLTYTPQALDFGMLFQGSRRTLGVALQNEGSGYVQGTVSSRFSWLRIPQPGFKLGPGAWQEVKVEAATSGLAPQQTHQGFLSVEGSMEAMSLPAQVHVEANVPKAVLSTTALDFGTVDRSQPRSRTFTITNTGNQELNGIIVNNDWWIEVQPQRFQGNSTTVTVMASVKRLEGDKTYKSTVFIESNGGKPQVAVTVRAASTGWQQFKEQWSTRRERETSLGLRLVAAWMGGVIGCILAVLALLVVALFNPLEFTLGLFLTVASVIVWILVVLGVFFALSFAEGGFKRSLKWIFAAQGLVLGALAFVCERSLSLAEVVAFFRDQTFVSLWLLAIVLIMLGPFGAVIGSLKERKE